MQHEYSTAKFIGDECDLEVIQYSFNYLIQVTLVMRNSLCK